MFTIMKRDSDPPFIYSFDIGRVSRFPSLFYCRANFAVCHYQDTLFEQFSIPFPEQLNIAVTKRKAEYLAARYATKKILQAYGCDEVPGIAPDRAPAWPSGWHGSISHSHECAIAVITPDDSGLIPGIDIEFLAPESILHTAYIFSSQDEQDLLAVSNIDYPTALLIVFSAKESLFKALYPEIGRFFDFNATRVCKIETSTQRITLELTQNLSTRRVKGCLIQGYYFVSDNIVTTVIA